MIRHKSGSVHRLRFFGAEGGVVTEGSDGILRVWRLDAEAPTLEREINLGGSPTFVMASNASNLAVAILGDATIRSWNLDTGAEVKTWRGHRGQIQNVSITPGDAEVLSTSLDGTVRVWEVPAAPPQRLHQAAVPLLNFDPRGEFQLSGSWDNTIRIARRDASTRPIVLGGLTFFGGRAAAFDAKRGRVAALLDGFTTMLAPLEDPASAIPLRGEGDVTALRFSPEADRLYTVARDGKLLRWAVDQPVPESGVLSEQTTELTALDLSYSGRLLALGDVEGHVHLLDAETGTPRWRGQDFASVISSLAFTPDAERLIVCGNSKHVTIYDVETGRILGKLGPHSGAVESIAIAPDARRIATGSWHGGYRIWDLQGMEEVASQAGRRFPVTSLAFTPEGEDLVVGYYDGVLERMRAAPYRHPGPPDADWREVYEASLKTRKPAPREAAEPVAERYFIYTTAALLKEQEEGLRAQAATLAPEQDQPRALRLQGGELLETFAPLGLRAGDLLRAVGGQRVDTIAGLLRAIGATGPLGRAEVEIERDGRRLMTNWVAIEVTTAERSILMEPGEVPGFLLAARGRLVMGEQRLIEHARDWMTALGIPAEPSGRLAGIWLTEPVTDEEKKLYLRLGLAENDRITRVNGEAVQSVHDLLAALVPYDAPDAPAEGPHLRLEIFRGQFNRQLLELTLPSPGTAAP